MAEGGSDDLTPKDLTGDPGEGVESGVGGGEQQAEPVKHEPTPAKSAKKVTTDTNKLHLPSNTLSSVFVCVCPKAGSVQLLLHLTCYKM